MWRSGSRWRSYHGWLILGILGSFVVFGFVFSMRYTGDDLAASYVGCRLVASGQAAHLYSHDESDFSELGDDDAWQSTADAAGFTGYLHPYVQTPLWAYGLQPLCVRTSFRVFQGVFAALTMVSFAGLIWLVARFWAPSLMTPAGLGAVAICLACTEPFRYSMFLMQTHVLFVLMTVGALLLAERGRPIGAGLLLACAAAVKITPGFLLLYWLMTRRWKAAGVMVIGSALLWGATILLTGQDLVRTYLADLHRVSGILLVSWNNQSLAAWSMDRFYPGDKVFDMDILPLPAALRLGSTLLLVLSTVVGGAIDRRKGAARAPLGAMIALVGATLFAPIAWTHYFIVLLAPLMVLVNEAREHRERWVVGAVVVLVLLNVRPLAGDVLHGHLNALSMVRSHFYSGVLCLGTLAVAAWRRHKRDGSGGRSTSSGADVLTAHAA